MYHINILYIMQYGIYTILCAYAISKYTIAAIICYTNLYSWLLYTETNVYIVLEILYVNIHGFHRRKGHIWMVPSHCVMTTLRCQTFEHPPLMIFRTPAFIGDMPLPSLAFKKQLVQWCSPNFVFADDTAAIFDDTPPWTVHCVVRPDCYRYLRRPGGSASSLQGLGSLTAAHVDISVYIYRIYSVYIYIYICVYIYT